MEGAHSVDNYIRCPRGERSDSVVKQGCWVVRTCVWGALAGADRDVELG